MVKKHPGTRFHFLKSAWHLSDEMQHIVLQHHERVDGKGYPEGLPEGRSTFMPDLLIATFTMP